MSSYLHFSCGRRGVNETTCRWCEELIHHNEIDDTAERESWLDGALRSKCDLPLNDPRALAYTGTETHHEPALEMGPILGPFDHDYVQITYNAVRHESEAIAVLLSDGDWMIQKPWTGAGERYSDITINAQEG